jgi:hypothetical protein
MLDPPDPEPSLLERWFAPATGESYVRARFLFLRGLGFVFFSAFLSLWFQIDGLIGPRGILPADEFLARVRAAAGVKAFWLVPSLFWIDASSAALYAATAAGLVASLALVCNVWPRLSIAVCLVSFLSFVAAAQDFSSYQSDGMLLEAAFLSLFFAPRGLLPRLGAHEPPSRAALFLLRWEWFRIYFESGLVKLLSGEPQWRNFTAMDRYYENGPLPTWIGWHVQHFPHAFHAASAAVTLLVELFVVWLVFVPSRKARIACFAITSLLQIGIILTANYAFLNYLVLFLGVLLLDDASLGKRIEWATIDKRPSIPAAVVLTTHLVTTSVMFFFPSFPLAVALEPSRIVNNFGLFAVMTRGRYEIEFQGSVDGRHWTAWPFRFKPQDVRERPGIYAPYQPRFEWNLWFASLSPPESNPWVLNVETRLLQESPPVERLFRHDPFGTARPRFVRTVLWQYWFTTPEERARTGAWWRREARGAWGPAARRLDDGTIAFE